MFVVTNILIWTLNGLKHYYFIFNSVKMYQMIHQAFEEHLFVHLSIIIVLYGIMFRPQQ